MSPSYRPRPEKKSFSLPEQERLRTLAVQEIYRLLLPDEDIIKIILIGSSVKGTFGEYAPPGFLGHLFSDFDFIVFVKDNYDVPAGLEREPDGRPFENEALDHAYRVSKIVEGRYDVEVFFVYESSLLDGATLEKGEEAGLPMGVATTKNPFLQVYPRT
jgi:predicted nucleotidyltransferase